MLQEDNLDFWKRSQKRKHLISQVLQVAHQLEHQENKQQQEENKEVADLSATLPTTPKNFGACDDEPAPKTPMEEHLDDAIEPASKKQKTEPDTKAPDVALTLDRWMVETFLENQPTDLKFGIASSQDRA